MCISEFSIFLALSFPYVSINSNATMPSKIAHYDRLKTIGEGTYGVVYKARDTHNNNEWVALKRMFMDDDNEGISSTTMREVAILKQLSHPNIVELKSIFFDSSSNRNRNSSGDLYLVFECMSCDLKQHMNKYYNITTMPIEKIKKYLFQILKGIAYCHSSSILHRDIKPQNILINEQTEEIKITDFGLSRAHILPNRTWTHEIITLWYRPPEVLLGCRSYSIYVDVWSIGCIFAEMLNRNKPLFRGHSEISQLMQIFMKCGSPNSENWPDAATDCKHFDAKYPQWKRKHISKFCARTDLKKDAGMELLDQMLILDPKRRITPKQAMNHEWFANGGLK